MKPAKYTIVRDLDPELADAAMYVDDPEDADELLELVHARRPCARVTIYDELGGIVRRKRPRSWVEQAQESN